MEKEERICLRILWETVSRRLSAFHVLIAIQIGNQLTSIIRNSCRRLKEKSEE